MAFIRDNKNMVKGDELWLFIGTSATTKPICFSTSHQLSRSLSTSSVSSKDHGNTSYVVPGEGSWTDLGPKRFNEHTNNQKNIKVAL